MNLLRALRSPTLTPWLIALPAAILRAWNLTTTQLWYDEAFTRLVAGLPLADLIAATAGDVHPPLYYLIVWLSGTSPLALRVPSVIFSILALVVFWKLTGEMGLTRPARLVALAVMAYHPSEIYYAKEARMYALLQMLVLWQILSIYRGQWYQLGISTVLVLYTHNYGAIYTAVALLVGFMRVLATPRPVYRPGLDGEFSGTPLPWMLAAFGAAGVLWLPWLGVLASQVRGVIEVYWINPLTAGSVMVALLDILGGKVMPQSIQPVGWFAISVGLLVLLIHGLKTKNLSLLVMAFGPLALAVILSLFRSILLPRGLIGMLPPLAALAGSAFIQAKPRARWLGLALLLPLAVSTFYQFGVNERGHGKGGTFIPSLEQSTGLPVVHINDGTLILSQDPTNNFLLDAGCPPEGGRLSQQTRDALGFRSIRLEDLPEKYVFSAVLTPESTACHERIYKQLTQQGKRLRGFVEDSGEYGLWLEGK